MVALRSRAERLHWQGAITLIDNAITSSINSVPSVYWAYNTGGRFLPLRCSRSMASKSHSSKPPASGILTILKWTAAPPTPSAHPKLLRLLTPLVPRVHCTLHDANLFNGGGMLTDDTTSWAYYDYAHDVAWVGGTSGRLHKVTGVFKGTPAEIEDDTPGSGERYCRVALQPDL